jgi:hypothetical protein
MEELVVRALQDLQVRRGQQVLPELPAVVEQPGLTEIRELKGQQVLQE